VLLRARAPESPFQTVHTDFPYTAYRWSLRRACAYRRLRRYPRRPSVVSRQTPCRVSEDHARAPPLGRDAEPVREFSCFVYGRVVGPCGHALALTSFPRRDQSRAPSLECRYGRHRRRYYVPLGLPLRTTSLHLRLIDVAFARRAPQSRASPVPYQTFTTCPLPYSEGVLHASGHTRAVCCLRRDMIGSATPPFGAFSHEAAEVHLPWARGFAPAWMGIHPAFGFRRSAWTAGFRQTPGACYAAHRRAYRDGTRTRWFGTASRPFVGRVQDAP